MIHVVKPWYALDPYGTFEQVIRRYLEEKVEKEREGAAKSRCPAPEGSPPAPARPDLQQLALDLVKAGAEEGLRIVVTIELSK